MPNHGCLQSRSTGERCAPDWKHKFGLRNIQKQMSSHRYKNRCINKTSMFWTKLKITRMINSYGGLHTYSLILACKLLTKLFKARLVWVFFAHMKKSAKYLINQFMFWINLQFLIILQTMKTAEQRRFSHNWTKVTRSATMSCMAMPLPLTAIHDVHHPHIAKQPTYPFQKQKNYTADASIVLHPGLVPTETFAIRFIWFHTLCQSIFL